MRLPFFLWLSLSLWTLLILCTNISLSQGDFWTQTSGPPGAGVHCILATASGVFLGTAGGGIYYSTNNGDTWTQRNEGMNYGQVNALAEDSLGLLFAGTTRALFRSSDNGLSWQEIALSGSEVTTLLVVPGNRIFAGVDNSLQMSTDDGITWQSGGNGLPASFYYSLTMTSNMNMFVRSQDGVFRSTDAGSNWAAVNAGLPNTSTSALGSTPGGRLFVGIFLTGIYASTDNGDSWTQVNAGLGDLRVFGFGATSTHVFAGTGGGIYQSSNNGGLWTASNTGFKNPYVGARCFLLQSDSLVLTGTDAIGILRSTDGGASWTKANTGLNSCLVQSVAFTPAGNLVAGTWGGVFTSTDHGASWVQSDSGITNTLINTVAVHPNGSLFAGSFPYTGTPLSCAFRSTNNGVSWIPVRSGWTYTFNNVLGFAFNSSGHVYAASNDNVYKSTNNGDSWFRANTGLSNSLVYSIAVNRDDDVFAGTYGSGMFRSTNGGASWVEINNGLTSTQIMSLAIDSNGWVFAGSNGSGVFRSTDKGEMWVQVLGVGRFLQAWALAINRDGQIFTGIVGGQYADFGVWHSTDHGENWGQVNTGLYGSSPPVQALGVDPGGFAFAGTIGSGLFRSTSPTTTVSGNLAGPPLFELNQNYPNPFNPTTRIQFTLPPGTNGRTSLRVFDVLGREVATLINEEMGPGKHESLFDGSGLASGVYFYRLENGSYSETKRLLLLR